MATKRPTRTGEDAEKKPGPRRRGVRQPTVTATATDQLWTEDGIVRPIVADLLRQVIEQAPDAQILGRLVLHYDSGPVNFDDVTSDMADELMSRIEIGSDTDPRPDDNKSTVPWISLVRIDVLAVEWIPQQVRFSPRDIATGAVNVGPAL